MVCVLAATSSVNFSFERSPTGQSLISKWGDDSGDKIVVSVVSREHNVKVLTG